MLGSGEAKLISGDDCQIVCIRDGPTSLWQVYVEYAGHEGVEKGKNEDPTLWSIF